MSPENLKICKDNQVCRIHATGGTCKFEGSCRWKHTTADERKKMGLSFSATSSKGEDQREYEGDSKNSLKPAAEEALINSLLDDVREVTAAGPVANRGDAFHNQFGFGHFAATAGEFSTLTSEDEQLFAEEIVMNVDTVEEEDVPNEPDEMLGVDKSELEREVQLLFKDQELEVVKTTGDGSCLFHAVQVSAKINAKQLRQMAAGAVITYADVEFNGMSIRQWIFQETKMTIIFFSPSLLIHRCASPDSLPRLEKGLGISLSVFWELKYLNYWVIRWDYRVSDSLFGLIHFTALST